MTVSFGQDVAGVALLIPRACPAITLNVSVQVSAGTPAALNDVTPHVAELLSLNNVALIVPRLGPGCMSTPQFAAVTLLPGPEGLTVRVLRLVLNRTACASAMKTETTSWGTNKKSSA